VRIIGGRYRGRRLQAFKGSAVRPTADRVRESLFNILGSQFTGAAVLDLFAGTGALGIEALSRGAERAVFVDKSTRALAVLRKNLDQCGLQHCSQVIQWDIARNLNCLKGHPEAFDLVFLDPPYHCALVPVALQHLADSGCLVPGAVVSAEHEAGIQPQIPSSRFVCTDNRRYGRTAISIFAYR
jgi:16S rRNA (guanine966-N2)-methyltransferase